ncbi:nucleotide exchange factor GrpE [Kurthia huakuii]|uniref:nucleotide exchange factor GrpE n=1 Tax=Kurthia huakuii TaxID=1421019 RepID=UPI000495500D|nr:nucleotide exchange factor GrpE [Kurthia huakuii]MBM7697965.1 molecular chaperone GrpE [Kurthia huakuii]
MTDEKKENQEQAIEETEAVEEVVETTEEAEVVTEAIEEAAEEVTAVDPIEELEAKLATEEERYLRLRADFDNLKRRSQLDREAQAKYRAQSLLTDLLSVLDNFERALSVEATTEEAQNMKKGIDMVYRALVEATEKEGLTIIATEGAPFDPNVHQAVMQESDPEQQSGIVLQELQRGYQLKDRVLRPAMVKVNE